MALAEPSTTESDRLLGELSDLAIRILQLGGAPLLASCATALVEGSAAALPEQMIPHFCARLINAVANGGRIAGHDVTVSASVDVAHSGELH